MILKRTYGSLCRILSSPRKIFWNWEMISNRYIALLYCLLKVLEISLSFIFNRGSMLIVWFRSKWKQGTLRVVTIAMICSILSSLWKFQYFRRPIYKPIEHQWRSFYCENSTPLSIFTKRLHRRCSLGF